MMRARMRVLASLLLVAAPACLAQAPRIFTAADYARAEKFMPYNTAPLVLHAAGRPTWVADDRFWYRTTTENGYEFVMYDAARGTRQPVFDQARIAAAISAATG